MKEILTIQELAEYPMMNPKTLQRKAPDSGQFPRAITSGIIDIGRLPCKVEGRVASKKKAPFLKELKKPTQQGTHLNHFENEADQIKDSELRYRRLFEAARDGILILDAITAQIIDVNPFLIELLGYSKKEFLGKKLWDVGSFKNVKEAKSVFEKLQNECYVRYEDMPLETKNGRLISVEFVSNVYKEDHVNVIQCNIRDITDRKIAEKERHKAEVKYQDLYENAPVAYYSAGDNGVIKESNKMLSVWLGFSPYELARMNVSDIYATESKPRVDELTKGLQQGINIENEELVYRRKNGEKMYGSLSANPIKDENNHVFATRSVVKDITERKQIMEALEESEKRYSTIFQTAAEGILVAEIETKRFKFANPAICRMLGYSQVELESTTLDCIHPKDSPKWVLSEFDAQSQGKRIVSEDIPCLRKDGTILFADIKSAQSSIEGTKCNVGFFTDVTERRNAEESKKQNLEKTVKALDSTIQVLSKTVEIRDPYTAGHQQRVSNLAVCIARELNFSAKQIEGIRVAGILHDVGKLRVPAEILSKPGLLNEIELALMRIHSQAGYDILKIIEFSEPIAQIVLQHHEKMDGSGYPGHILGKDILIEARIICVADVVEAMASHRPYRPALGIDKALEEISQNSGVLYDSEVVGACLKVVALRGFKFD